MQSNTWLGDMVDEVIKVELVEGNTMMIPTGWIHAVVSTLSAIELNSCHVDNMLGSIRLQTPWYLAATSFTLITWQLVSNVCISKATITDCRLELKVRDIEIATQVPKKFRFPLFSRLVVLAHLRRRYAQTLRVQALLVCRGEISARFASKGRVPSPCPGVCGGAVRVSGVGGEDGGKRFGVGKARSQRSNSR